MGENDILIISCKVFDMPSKHKNIKLTLLLHHLTQLASSLTDMGQREGFLLNIKQYFVVEVGPDPIFWSSLYSLKIAQLLRSLPKLQWRPDCVIRA